ncbi:hypothetical protein FF125_00420 [Aureibaculum algae]|uniref:Beta-carotene 15,15'-monooxygenase n=1 Tax=Aureibaculum algae TaxID=2584122 RepID=A0A5B7TKA7_9FLAO|nr:DUF6427 family protein [Aureibaculum algae]QCX36969.1 hypothetical protein FF125_00420 [Aureibaculum algae]
MIANFFNKSTPVTTFTIFILITLVILVSIFSTPAIDFSFTFFLKKLAVLSFLMLTLLLVQFITKKNGLIKDNAFDLLLIVLFIAMFPKVISEFKLLGAHFVLLLAFRRIYSLRTIKNPKEKLFDSSFYIGVATIIYPWCILYMVLPYAAIINFNKRTIRNVLLPLVGLITSFIIYASYLMLIDKFDTYEMDFTTNFVFTNYNSLNLLIPLTLLLGFIIWVIFPTTLKIISINSDLKNAWFVLTVHLIVSILIIIPAPVKNGSEFLFLFFPTAVLFTNYLQMVKEKWFKDVFLYLFVAAAIVSIFL